LENLFYLRLLERAFNSLSLRLPPSLLAADIGPPLVLRSDPVLAAQMGSATGREVRLTGYEIDAYRIYADFHSRYDHALVHARGLEGQYLPASFERQPGRLMS
jgi:hypothetical protein